LAPTFYDFTCAGNLNKPSPYVLHGTISRIYPESVEMSIPDGVMYVSDPEAIRASMSGGPRSQLQALAALKMGQMPISESEYYLLDPATQANFKATPALKTVYILHFADNIRDAGISAGTRVGTLAMPTTTPGFWDHGTKVSNLPDRAHFFRVYPDHIESVTNISSITNSAGLKIVATNLATLSEPSRTP
jgi:hypothetical protein